MLINLDLRRSMLISFVIFSNTFKSLHLSEAAGLGTCSFTSYSLAWSTTAQRGAPHADPVAKLHLIVRFFYCELESK